MSGKTLVLEGLPADYDLIKTKLALYFKNKRRSGGEILELQADPTDKRRALLVYHDDKVLNNVLSKTPHHVDLKQPFGFVELQVKLSEEEKAQPVFPAQAVSVSVLDASKGSALQLRVTSERKIESIELYLEQFVEVPILRKHGEKTWILQLSNKSDMEMVCASDPHLQGISMEVYDEREDEGKLDGRRYVLSGFHDDCSSDSISMYINSCSRRAEHAWETVDRDRIVVTFTQDIDVHRFMEKISTKKFDGRKIEAYRLGLTKSVLVQGDLNGISEEVLVLHFTNEKRSRGDSIHSLSWIHPNKDVVITFEDWRVAQKVAESEQILIRKKLVAQLFYAELQRGLTGQTQLEPNFTRHITIQVNGDILSIITRNEAFTEELTSALKKVNAIVSINVVAQPPQMELKMSLDKHSLGMLRHGPSWESNARREAQSQLEKYTVEHLPLEAEVWREFEGRCPEVDSVNAVVYFKISTSELVVVGRRAQMESLVKEIKDKAEKARDCLQLLKNTVEQEICLDSKERLGLIWDRVVVKLTDVDVSKNEENFTLHLKGLRERVKTAETLIQIFQDTLVTKKLDFPQSLLKFVQSLDLQKFHNDQFSRNNIIAVLLFGEKFITILANRGDIDKAEVKLTEAAKQEVIPFSGEYDMETFDEQWGALYDEIMRELESTQNSHNVLIQYSKDKIILCGFSNVVDDVFGKVMGRLQNKKLVTEDVPLNTVEEVDFVETCMKLSAEPKLKELGATILPCRSQQSPCLKVTATSEQIKKAIDTVTTQISAIITNKHTYSNAGEAKILKKNESLLLVQSRELNCNLKISEQTAQSQQFSYNIEGSLTLTLTQGNIAQQTLDALICPLDNLSFNNPIAQQFLQCGGPDIKNVINTLVKENQSLMAGDVVMTGPGNLKCKKLLYAAIPVWGKSTSQLESRYVSSAVQLSLVKAATNHCVTLGVPALGCGTFGFPVKESCEAIIKGIRSFVAMGYEDLTGVHLTELDPKILAEFKSAIEALGFHSTLSPRKNISIPPAPRTSPHGPNTIVFGTVTVTAKRADITEEKVDVIVNSNNIDLDLSTGVSDAILKAAGQPVVDECKKHGRQVPGTVVLTGGGNLKCKHIAQIVGPGDILASVKKVLELCESKMAASVSFPTIGTGRGGTKPKNSAKAILEGLQNHIRHTPLSSLKEVFIVAYEDRTYEPLKKYFNKLSHSKQMMPALTAPVNTFGLFPNQVNIKDVLVEVKRGDITEETVGAIVNSTNENVDSINGVSGAILKAAGAAVEKECANIRPLKGHEAGVTCGGALRCDFIIHTVGPTTVAHASARVQRVLERCEDKGVAAVSFPAIGTGGGGLKLTDSIGAMLQGVKDHLSQRSQTVLRQIVVVADRGRTTQECEQGLSNWTSNQVGDDDDDDEDDSSDASSSRAATVEVKIGPVKVKVFSGDITREQNDAIVSSTNQSLNLSSGVSGAILKAAGQTVVDECKSLGTQSIDGVVITKPGQLATKHIIHMVGPTTEKDITCSMLKVFQLCEKHKIQSVSFPALGTGAGKLHTVDVGNAMVTAIKDHINTFKTTCLTLVHIVIFQTNMLKDFQGILKKCEKVTPAATRTSVKPPGLFSFLTQRLRGLVSTHQPSMCLDRACRQVSFPRVEVEVIGCSLSSVEKVQKLVDDLVTTECSLQSFDCPLLPLLLEQEERAIVALSQRNQVSVLVSAQGKKVSVSGKRDDALAVVLEIQKFLQNAKERESRQAEEKRLRDTVRWEAREGEVWVELDQRVSLDLELALHKKRTTVSFVHRCRTYIANPLTMERWDSRGVVTRIKRTLLANHETGVGLGDIDLSLYGTAVIEPPPSWDRMDNNFVAIVDLSPTSKEYKKVETNFLKSSKNPAQAITQTYAVIKIQRIQSKEQWQRYAVRKQMLDKKYPKDQNEVVLYHGTTEQICQKVNANGFNRSFCGRNATVYGRGTYFAKESWYSCDDTYATPDAQGVKYVYQARVLSGKPCLGIRDMVEPIPLDPSNPSAGLHDCAVNNLSKPFTFVVFCDAGAYPEYLITFKKS